MRNSILCILLLLGAIALLAGCKSPKESSADMGEWLAQHDKEQPLTWEGYMSQGDANVRQGNLEEAYLDYSKALKLQPDNLDLRMKRGDLLFRKQLMEKALNEYMAVLEKSPDRSDAHLGVGKVYFAVGRNKEAAQHLHKAKRDKCETWEAYALLGIMHDWEMETRQGELYLQRAYKCVPTNGDVLNNQGLNYMLQGKLDKAIPKFLAAIKAGNTEPKVYNNLGVALAKKEQYEDALEAFKLAGDEARAFNNIGYVLYQKGEYRKAITCFEKALSLHSAYYQEAGENLNRAKAALFTKQTVKVSSPEWDNRFQFLLKTID
ncbi:tetratricopeptide repeat protein [Desulfovibrio mangrovi]|uniref:tetratricopeptide repeat protein n=1 Tax=Desulfovibrio mangrovi TaxID=2976983 RepID=UPI002247132E|nr:tetratricopeptide repeat protein [Desulfovibrio mangrovi]UZP68799.1 tetratricopeptide repeat protein [Desulfovibrio mangrovi]